jgi:hypothetical protein
MASDIVGTYRLFLLTLKKRQLTCAITFARATGIARKTGRGVRLVEYGQGCRPGSVRFSSVGGRAQLFREGVSLYCEKHGLEWEDLPAECEIMYGKPGGKYVGHRWAYFLRADFQKAWDEFALLQPF